ncbi:AraC family transcriptional regulator [Flavobacterium bomense]|uniref:AraC family transcriptional regulator n=1 Tax=Flavobacterium bomense TaxID=2497483 RepID=A0A3S0NZC1_9FLAO|nr:MULTISPECIES: AraC family transcriptional regulator [Flavobacterium]RTY76697.1 AraC family transcriptional regulator [Flavobacterium sp. LS1R10]RTY92984.1 AraC family transcriptional regulator [Flavobacterium sp. RSP46]RTZ03143.1 AraC family transcriptional regulator [Flavobacterium bomense]
MKFYVKNMVCGRCIMVVKSELEKLGIFPVSVKLGEVEVVENFKENQKRELEIKLQSFGFELLEDKTTILTEKIKCLIIDLVHHQNEELKINLSHYLSEQLGQDYSTLSNLFSEMQGITIEHYFIAQKIEKVKELLMYKELTLSEIANKLNYSDVAHLSNQFKKITGVTPTHFKQLKENNRSQIDAL